MKDAPQVWQATLSWPMVDALFTDLAALATVEEVQLKGGAEAHARGAAVDLDVARRALVAGEVAGVQIRYHHDGARWCDTLLRAGDEVRVVRTTF